MPTSLYDLFLIYFIKNKKFTLKNKKIIIFNKQTNV